MALNAQRVIQTVKAIRMVKENGTARVSPDSELQGSVFRPFGTGRMTDQVATLQTLWDFWIDNVPDADTALAQDPNFDEIIRQQSDVHACMRLRELTVASMPWRVEPSDRKGVDPQLAQIAADYTTEVFEGIADCPEMFRVMQNAVLMGGQGMEFIWNTVNGYLRPVRFTPLHKSRFLFDRLGRMNLLTREYPVYGLTVAENPMQPVSPQQYGVDTRILPALGGKFVYHKYMVDGGPFYRPASEGYVYYGRGEDTNLYLPVTFDLFVLRFYMKYIEKHGFPLTILHYPDTMRPSSEVMKICESIRGESIVRIPRPAGENSLDNFYKVEFLPPPPGGADLFRTFHSEWSKPRIEKILLGGANLLELGDHGSYSASMDQRDAGAQIIFRWDAKKISETLTKQLIPYIVVNRWPALARHPEYWPKFVLEPKDIPDQGGRIETLAKTAELVPVREQDIYDAAGVEIPKDDEKCVFLGGQQGPESPFDAFPLGGGEGEQGEGQPPGQHAAGSNGKPPGGPNKQQRPPIGRKPLPNGPRPIGRKPEQAKQNGKPQPLRRI